MKQTTQIGATVEEAISLALQKLGHTREQVDVEVLQEGKIHHLFRRCASQGGYDT